MTAPARKTRPQPALARGEAPGVAALATLFAEQAADIRELRQEVSELRAARAPAAWPIPVGYVSLKSAARESGFSPEAIRLWAVAGAISAIRRGGAWFVKLADVMAHAGGGKSRSG
jgi:hypothetical protein